MEDFVGPLDLILHLLSKHRIEIRDIPISLLLDQYLAWMEQRERLNLEVASEFVAMAAHLVYIKTRMLLSLDDQEAINEMEQLMAALEEHRHHESYLKIRAVTGALEQRYSYGSGYMTKLPEVLSEEKTYCYRHRDTDLLWAIHSVLERMDSQKSPTVSNFQTIVGREPYPVSEKARAILRWLGEVGAARFRSLFAASKSRSEVVATFLAVLELCKGNRVVLEGTAENCTVSWKGEQTEVELDATVDCM